MIKIEDAVLEDVKTNGNSKVQTIPVTRPANGKKRRLALIGAAVVVAALAASVPAIYSAFTHESTDDAFIDGHIIGIAPKVAGEVLAVHITDNQLVREGEPLLEIDPRDYQAKVTE